MKLNNCNVIKVVSSVSPEIGKFLWTYLALVIGPEERQKSIRPRVSNSIVVGIFRSFTSSD